jgi:hypothetical protein
VGERQSDLVNVDDTGSVIETNGWLWFGRIVVIYLAAICTPLNAISTINSTKYLDTVFSVLSTRT